MHLQNRGSARVAYRRALTASVAVAASFGISSALIPAVASPTDNVSGLVRQMTTTQGDIDRLELLLGELREEVNRKLVDLDDAQGAAEQARQGAQAAGEALENSQSELELAQDALDEIARTAYRHGGGASVAQVTDLAGGDASEDMLDRQTFLRLRGEEQQRVVDDLDGARTESANADSRARAAAQLADARATAAVAAEKDAQASLDANVAELESVVAERDELIRQRDEAEAQLAQQRGSAPAEVVPEAVEEPTAVEPAADEPQGPQGEEPVVEAAPTAADEIAARVAQTQPDHESLSDPYQSEASESETAEAAAAAEATGVASVAGFAAPAIAAVQAPTGQSRVSAETEEDTEEPVDTVEPATSVTVEEEYLEGSAEESTTEESIQDSADAEAAGSSAGPAAGSSASLLTEVAQLLETTSAEQSTEATTTENSMTGDVAQELPSAEEVATDLETMLPEVDTAESVSQAISSESDRTEESTPENSSDTSSETGSNPLIESVIARAESQLGTPYAWGGGNANGPTPGIRDGGTGDANGDYNKVGFDCSGFTLYAFAGAGISLPHYTGYQYQRGENIDPQNMQRGDLIFYGPGGSQHVAIYLGDGMMIEAPSSGGVVQKTPVRWSGMAPNAVRLI